MTHIPQCIPAADVNRRPRWRPLAPSLTLLPALLAALLLALPGSALAERGVSGPGASDGVPRDGHGRPLYVPGEVLVSLRPGLPLTALGGRAAALARQALGTQRFGSVRRNFQRLRLAAGDSVESALAHLRADPAVEAAAPNWLNYHFLTPSDADFGDQWGLHNTQQTFTSDGRFPYGLYGINNPPSSADHDIDAPEAWDLGTGAGVVIAIIDDGLHRAHPDFSGNLADTSAYTPSSANSGYDYAGSTTSTDDPDADPQPVQLPVGFGCDGSWLEVSHGTHVAGIAAAVSNSAGVAGVAYGATVLSLKVFPDQCSGASDADIISAIAYAGNNGVDVANLSLGRNGPKSTLMEQALADAIAAGTVFVVAAGNEGSNNDSVPIWPANFAAVPATADGVISVAATDQADRLAFFSNHGLGTVTLGAPGVNMLSTVRLNNGTYGYNFFNGTSMASPVVTGVVALLKATEPSLTPAQIKLRLETTGDPILGGAGCTTLSGKRVNAYGALANSVTPTPCAIVSGLASDGSSLCLVTWLTAGVLTREQLQPLREVREALWQSGAWGQGLVRGYYRGSAAFLHVVHRLEAARRAALAAGVTTRF